MSTTPPRVRRRSTNTLERGTTSRDGEDQSSTTVGGSNERIAGGGSSRRKEDGDNSTNKKKQAWYIRWVKSWGSGMRKDIVARLPYYASDWTDAWNYRVVPATWVSLFTALAF
jgi:hypothetical protein